VGLRVVHADAACVVVDKDAGLPSVPGRPEHLKDSAAARVQQLYADARVVHRIDMPTSGLLLFARGPLMQRALSREFAARRVQKGYVAVVAGEMNDDAGTIELPIATDWERRPRRCIDALRGAASTTHWRVLARDPGRTRVELRPVTGRSHQLRVHLAAIGHPILGDALYAPPDVQSAAGRLLLHASTLELAHPASGATVRFASAVPF
jgi:tRNA pseudouridine32 synthase/23S rRNA pseudouridine746 synthase